MAEVTRPEHHHSSTLHRLGIVSGLAAGVWLGAAEAPAKLVSIGLSPFTVSLCMVAGVFTARWTFPTMLKGTGYVFADLRERKYLIVWALLAGALWAVANTLTVFAIRDVGLAVAFPLWNANSLIGLLWARLLFRELQGAGASVILRVLGGTLVIVAAATLLGFSTVAGGHADAHHAVQGIIAALGASLLWGTMYVPYRKAYISGMNPLSFVTAFTVGELVTIATLAVTLGGGLRTVLNQLRSGEHIVFWLFLGGLIWVVGDLFQQFAAKYLGIGRGIPLANTNQLWGLAWAALVFGELAHAGASQRLLVLSGSLGMLIGVALISSAAAPAREQSSQNQALARECDRYGLDYARTLASMAGVDHRTETGRRWWDYAILCGATAAFVLLAVRAQRPALHLNLAWAGVLSLLLLAGLGFAGWRLWRITRFS